MSRSKKKTPGFCDRNPWAKTYANRRFRRICPDDFEDQFGGGKSNRHRRYTCPWDICDFKFLYYSEQEVKRCVSHERGYYTLYQYYKK